MANITLMKCTDENNKVLKTPDLTTAKAYANGTFRDSVSVLRPVFRIATTDDLTAYNYCWIDEFNRYYFVEDITAVRNGLWEFTCRCDVLFTYSTEIYALKAVVKRQQEEFNTYLNDSQYMSLNYPRVQTYAFPTGFSSTFNYILTTTGKGGAI